MGLQRLLRGGITIMLHSTNPGLTGANRIAMTKPILASELPVVNRRARNTQRIVMDAERTARGYYISIWADNEVIAVHRLQKSVEAKAGSTVTFPKGKLSFSL